MGGQMEVWLHIANWTVCFLLIFMPNFCFRFVSSLPLTDFRFTMSLSHDVPLAASFEDCVYVLGTIQRTGEKLLLQYNTKQGAQNQNSLRLLPTPFTHYRLSSFLTSVFFLLTIDLWSELLPTLTKADADLPLLYFLGASDKLLVIGGNNSGNVVTSFCVKSKKWGQVKISVNSMETNGRFHFPSFDNPILVQVQRAEKVSFGGQGTLAGDQLLMPSLEYNSVVQMDLQTLSITAFPPLPVSTRYEAVFYLYF